MAFPTKPRTLAHLVAALLLLPLLCACSSISSDDLEPATPDIATSDHYINLNIVVSNGSESTMRSPLGGEDGDGREVGFERENKVMGITFMLYENDGKTINDSKDKKLAFVKYYSVREVSHGEQGTTFEPSSPSEKPIEATYTTGDQPLGELDLSKKYGVIVVANADLTNVFRANDDETTVETVCEYKMSTIYGGSGIGINAANFVMSLESDYTIDFADPDESYTTVNGKTYYTFNKILIERLAARIDFWMNKATYNESRETPGYEYEVTMDENNSPKDHFVLTAVTPFNLYNNKADELSNVAKEYLIKHVNVGGKIEYIADETESTLVVDPHTIKKTTGSTEFLNYYSNQLRTLVADPPTSEEIEAVITTESLNGRITSNSTDGYSTIERHHNFILCYPKENTLMYGSPLYYCATGLRIEGDYYKAGESAPSKHLTYYGYLRHQGEGSGNYDIVTSDRLDERAIGSQTTAMNYGVVRNNIYRISIESITEKKDDEPEVKLRIVVKNWDVFTHSEITM